MHQPRHGLRTLFLGLLSVTACLDAPDATAPREVGLASFRSFAGSSTCLVDLDFDDGALPSAHGMSYLASLPEASAFSVSGGLLHLNTTGFSVTEHAAYHLPAAYDATLDFVLELSMVVFTGTDPFGVDFEVSNTSLDFEVGFVPNGLFLPPPRPFFPFNTADRFHTYRLASAGGSGSYNLAIDGVQQAAAVVELSGDPSNKFIFGDLTAGSAGRADIDFVRYCQFRSVSIDIKPGSYPNSINLGSQGVVPVAILSTPDFDATTVDATTLSLAGSAVRLRSNGTVMVATQDVNGDGMVDLVVHFETSALQLSDGDTDAVVEGRTIGGTPVRGIDLVRIVP